jgi:hypothetical protein
VARWIRTGEARERGRFGLLRVATTENRFWSALGAPPVVGRWYELAVAPEGKGPGLMSWFAGLEPDGYTSLSRGFTLGGEPLTALDDGDVPPLPRSVGAAAAPARQLPTAIVAACSPLSSRDAKRLVAADVLGSVPPASRVRVRDVGQASFVTLEDDRFRSLLHFDVGTPVSFNGHTFPKGRLRFRSQNPVPVLLSHWDWDHLHAGLQQRQLRRGSWVVPNQRMGPGAARLATELVRGGMLSIWRGGVQSFAWGRVGQCTGADGLNDTGLAGLVSLANGDHVLLAGDAAYSSIPAALSASVDALVSTHHGGRLHLGDAPPRPARHYGRWIISCGRGNTYRHPHPEALIDHAAAGWGSPEYTRKFGCILRGDRYL